MKTKKFDINYLFIIAGAGILAFGLFNIHSQTNITEGGILGTLLLLEHWFGITPSITSFILDFSCYALGYKFLGKQFLKYSIFATICFSTLYQVFSMFGPQLGFITSNELLSSIVGGLFVGVGVGIVVRVGGACGGDDALALLIGHFTKCKISTAYLLTDVTVLLLSLSYIPFQDIFYSLITVTISSNIIHFIQTKKVKPIIVSE